VQRLREAAELAPSVACLPELFGRSILPGRRTRPVRLAEPIPGPTTEALAPSHARRAWSSSLPLRAADGRIYPIPVIFDAERVDPRRYRKMHIPTPVYYEKYYFNARRPRLPDVRDQGGAGRDLGLLGPVVSEAAG